MRSIGIGIGISDTGPVFTWYRIDTKICSIAHPYSKRQADTFGYSERWNCRTPSYKRNEKGRKDILHIVHIVYNCIPNLSFLCSITVRCIPSLAFEYNFFMHYINCILNLVYIYLVFITVFLHYTILNVFILVINERK